MRRFVSKIARWPRAARPAVDFGPFRFEGSFFLVTQEPVEERCLRVSGEPGVARVSRHFPVMLDENELKSLQRVRALAFDGGLARELERAGALLVPAFEGGSEWAATMKWVREFEKATALSVYEEHLVKRDKKNQGKKLEQFLVEAKHWIQRIVEFVAGIEEPIPEWIEKADVCGEGINKKHFVAAFTALEFVADVIDRTVSWKGKGYRVGGVVFDGDEGVKPQLLLEPVGVQETEFPDALSRRHKRFLECLDGHSVLQKVVARIPGDFKCSTERGTCVGIGDAKQVHLNSSFAGVLAAIEPFVREVIRPPATFDNGASLENVETVAKELFNYHFVSKKILGMLVKRDSDLAFLGRCVLDMIFGVAIVHACPEEDIQEMLAFKTTVVDDLFLRKLRTVNNLDRFGFFDIDDIRRLFGGIFVDSGCRQATNAIVHVMKQNESHFKEMFGSTSVGSSVQESITESLSITRAPECWIPELLSTPLNKLCIAVFLYLTGVPMTAVAPKLASFRESSSLKATYEDHGLVEAIESIPMLLPSKEFPLDELQDTISRLSDSVGSEVSLKQIIVNGKVMSFFDTKDGHRLPFFVEDHDWLLSQHKLIRQSSEFEAFASVRDTPARETGSLKFHMVNV